MAAKPTFNFSVAESFFKDEDLKEYNEKNNEFRSQLKSAYLNACLELKKDLDQDATEPKFKATKEEQINFVFGTDEIKKYANYKNCCTKSKDGKLKPDKDKIIGTLEQLVAIIQTSLK
jgi:hypothetical protein